MAYSLEDFGDQTSGAVGYNTQGNDFNYNGSRYIQAPDEGSALNWAKQYGGAYGKANTKSSADFGSGDMGGRDLGSLWYYSPKTGNPDDDLNIFKQTGQFKQPDGWIDKVAPYVMAAMAAWAGGTAMGGEGGMFGSAEGAGGDMGGLSEGGGLAGDGGSSFSGGIGDGGGIGATGGDVGGSLSNNFGGTPTTDFTSTNGGFSNAENFSDISAAGGGDGSAGSMGGGDGGGLSEGGGPASTAGGVASTPLSSLKDMYNQYKTPLGMLSKLFQGAKSYQGQNQTAQANQNYMSQLSDMYKPGTPEYEMMKQRIEREDAKRGRRSQYGTREVELAARMADLRSRNMTSPAYSQAMTTANNSQANNLNGAFSLADYFLNRN